PEHRSGLPQQVERIGVCVALIGVGEVLPDVAHGGRAEQRVDDRVREHVGVRVTRETSLMGYLHTAEDQGAANRERMAVVTDARRDHRPSSTAASSRSAGVVTLMLLVGESITRTVPPTRSTSQASSVAVASTSPVAAVSARSSASRRNTWGV